MRFQERLARRRMRDNDCVEVDLGLTIMKVSNKNLKQLTKCEENPQNVGRTSANLHISKSNGQDHMYGNHWPKLDDNISTCLDGDTQSYIENSTLFFKKLLLSMMMSYEARNRVQIC
jgi:hypothetical protein